LAPADFSLFQKVKEELAGLHLTQESLKSAWEGVTRTIGEDEFATAFWRWYECSKKCVRIQGEYVEKSQKINTFLSLMVFLLIESCLFFISPRTVHRYAAAVLTWLFILHMYIQHEYVHALWTWAHTIWTCTLNMDMHHGHGYSWTGTCTMDIHHGRGIDNYWIGA
jgi:hypothetical protein